MVFKLVTFTVHWIVPPLAAWELAALVHVYLVALKLMQFRGFEFATKKFNSRAKTSVFNMLIIFIIVKLIAITLQTKVGLEGEKVVQLVTLAGSGVQIERAFIFIAPYILMMPLFFFFAVNWCAQRHVVRQARALGIEQTGQEKYLVGLMKFVDAPVVLPFLIMFLYLKFVDPMFGQQTDESVFGIIGCCLLIVSNLLTGVFDEHWSDLMKSRGEYIPGLA